MQAALLSLSKPPTPASAAPGFAFPSPTTSPGLLLRLGSLLTAHPALLTTLVLRVNLLFSKLCLLPGFTLLQAQGGGGGQGWPRHTPQLRQPTLEGTRLGPYLGNPNLVLALSSLIATVSPCPLGWVSRRGGKKRAIWFACIPPPRYF